MVEGHQCHRVGHAHRRLLLGKRFIATSPNGRFVEGAAAISGKILSRIEVHGKNLFYFFGGSLRSSNSTDTSAQQQQQPHIPILQPIDEDPLQAGALDSDSEGGAGDTAAAAAAAAAAAVAAGPKTPGRRTRRATAAPEGSPSASPAAAAAAAAGGSPVTPSKPLLAAVGSAAAAALGKGPGLTSPAAAAPNTPGSTPAAQTAATPAAAAGAAGSAESDVVVVHIHFGMSGAFRTASLPGPDPTPTTRLRLVHEGTGLMAHLSAMTVAHGGLGLYQEKVSKLGPDPLRPDDDAGRFWARVQNSKKPIGLLLMDQTAVAGVGNIYRAEILYKTGLHPEQPGHTVDRDTFEVLWGHCVDLLHRGFTSGSILTVDPEDARTLGKPWTRRYIYNQRQCGRCKGPVKVWDMATRTVYCCEICQPLRLPAATALQPADTPPAAAAAAAGAKPGRKGRSRSAPAAALDSAAAAAAAGGAGQDHAAVAAQLLHPSRLKSMAAAKIAQEFVSHCAPDDPSDLQPSKMTCDQLRSHLKALNLNTRGNKPQLVARLEAAKTWMAAPGDAPPAAAAAKAAAGADSDTEVLVVGDSSESGDELDKAEDALAERLSVPPAKKRRTTTAAAAAGPRHGVASAKAAEAEKAAAGENRAVEHVALHADAWTDQLMFGGGIDGVGQQQQQQVEVTAVGGGTPSQPRRTGRTRQ